jgi:hypothetical protein
MNPSGQERRKTPRVPLLVRVECKTARKYVLGHCENISETGMLVTTTETFDVAEPVTLRFMLPPISAGKAVQATATVLRTDAGESMAFQFVRLPESFRRAIAEFIERNKTELAS